MKKTAFNLFVGLLLIGTVSAQNISIDQTFGNNGLLKQSYTIGTGRGSGNDFSYDLIVLPDNKTFVCGTTESSCNQEDFAVIKLLPNGELDKSFNGNGMSILSLSSGEDWAYSIAMQSDGKIVLGGTIKDGNNLNFAVARVNADGSIDKTFNNEGFAVVDMGGYDWAKKVAVWEDKIIIGGYSIASGDTSYAVARFNADGSLDATFNGTGKKRFTEPGREMIGEMSVDGSGNVFIAGYKTTTTSYDMYIVKISPDGSYDISFDGDGKSYFNPGNYINEYRSIYIQDNGKILLGGSLFNRISGNYIEQTSIIIRLNADGSFDTSFGVDGLYEKASQSGVPDKIIVDANGAIIAASQNFVGGSSPTNLELLKIDVNAVPDPNFGTNGMLYVPIMNYRTTNALNVDAEGRIVSSVFSYENGFTTVRCLADGTIDNTFGVAGVATHRTSTSNESINAIQYTRSNGILIGGIINWGWVQPVISKLTSDGDLDKTFAGGVGSEFFPLETLGSTVDVLELRDKSFIQLLDYKVVKVTEVGELETSFNSTGYVDIDFEEPAGYVRQILATPNEELLILGSTSAADYSAASKKIFLMKLLPNGDYDNSFGTDGKIKILLSDYLPGKSVDNSVLKMQLLPNGKILVAMRTDGVLLLRLNANGSIDNTFGNNGFYINETGDTFIIQNFAIENDGNIIMAGSINVAVSQNIFAARRLLANGSQIDHTFAGTGTFSIPDFYVSSAEKVYANNEHILLIGYGSDQDYNPSHLIVQLNLDGSIASDFNSGTYYTKLLEYGTFYNAVVTKSSDGKLLLMNNFQCRYAAVQFLTNQVDQEPVATSILSPKSNAQANELNVFPNPASQNFKINLTNSNETEGKLTVTNTSGYEVKHIEAYNFSQDVSVSDLKAGLYFVQLKTLNGGIYTRKLIVN